MYLDRPGRYGHYACRQFPHSQTLGVLFSVMSVIGVFYHTCFSAARILGCHQRPDRSFFICGKQFPVCARCTGVFLGECIGIICYRLFQLPSVLLLTFCGLMFLDWLMQYLKVRESTNMRRLITGLLCGYAYMTFVLKGLIALKTLLISQR